MRSCPEAFGPSSHGQPSGRERQREVSPRHPFMILETHVIRSRKPFLGGYASKQCARRVHNDFDPTIPKEPWQPPPELQARFDAGLAFESDVFDRLEEALGDRCLRLDRGLSKQARVDATLQAMNDGIEVILEGQLPDDVDGGRVGKPDILVRWSESGTPPRYLPADVKHHRTAKTSVRKSLWTSPLAAPSSTAELPGLVEEVSGRFDDFLQLAHYTRMLQACGFHPGRTRLWAPSSARTTSAPWTRAGVRSSGTT